MRKPIQIAVSEADTHQTMFVLCDDGTIWVFNDHGQWVEMPAIPQDESKDPLAVAVGKLQAVQHSSDAWLMSEHGVLRRAGERLREILKRG